MQNPEAILQPSLNLDPTAIAFAKIADRLDQQSLEPLDIYDLATTDEDVLAFLAEQFSVLGLEGLHWATTPEEKRQLIKNAIPLHKLKGTLEGYRTILRMTKQAHLDSYISPPDIPYPSARTTQEEWNRFLEQMPQIRLYRYDVFGVRQGTFLNQQYHLMGGDVAPEHKTYLYSSNAWDRFQEKPELWYPDGRVERLRWWQRETVKEDGFATTIDAVIRPGKALGTFLVGSEDSYPDPFPVIGIRNDQGDSFLIDHDPLSRIFYLENSTPFTAQQDEFIQGMAHPGYDQLRVQYDFIQERSTARGQFFGKIFLAPSEPYTPPPPPSPVAPAVVKTSMNMGGSTYVL